MISERAFVFADFSAQLTALVAFLMRELVTLQVARIFKDLPAFSTLDVGIFKVHLSVFLEIAESFDLDLTDIASMQLAGFV